MSALPLAGGGVCDTNRDNILQSLVFDYFVTISIVGMAGARHRGHVAMTIFEIEDQVGGPTRLTESDQTAYRLSRVYAEGWNVGRTAAGQDLMASNPYGTEPERARWEEGYLKATG